MAKLARLMQPGPPQFFDPAQRADSRDELSGVLDINGMQGLHELLSDNVGSIQFELHFDKNEQGRTRISGQYSTVLSMQCQRCLQPVNVTIAGHIDVVLFANELEAAKLSKKAEPFVMRGRKISLQKFFEDELLLALPLAPSHDTEVCHAQTSERDRDKMDRQRPFAVLKDLKMKNSKERIDRGQEHGGTKE